MPKINYNQIRLFTIQPREVWEALENSPTGTLMVNPDHEDVWQDFRTSYRWLIDKMSQRIPDYSGGYPWWAWTKRPDMRREVWQVAQGKPFSLIELELPLDQVVLTDFDIWNSVLNGQYASWSQEEDYAWDTEWTSRFGDDHWQRTNVPIHLLNERTQRIAESWERVFDWENPKRDKNWWGDITLQATFETLNLKQVKRVSHHMGRRKRQ